MKNNNLLFHFNGHNNDLLVLKQLKGAFNRIITSLLRLLPLLCKKASGSSIILYIFTLYLCITNVFLQKLEDNLGRFTLSLYIAPLLNLKALFTCVTFRTSP